MASQMGLGRLRRGFTLRPSEEPVLGAPTPLSPRPRKRPGNQRAGSLGDPAETTQGASLDTCQQHQLEPLEASVASHMSIQHPLC